MDAYDDQCQLEEECFLTRREVPYEQKQLGNWNKDGDM